MDSNEFKKQLIKQKNPKKLLSVVSNMHREDRYKLKEGILNLIDSIYINNKATHYKDVDNRNKQIINNCYIFSFLVVDDFEEFKSVLYKSKDTKDIHKKYDLYQILSNPELAPVWLNDFLLNRYNYFGIDYAKFLCDKIGIDFQSLGIENIQDKEIFNKENAYGGTKLSYEKGIEKLKKVITKNLYEEFIVSELIHNVDYYQHHNIIWYEENQKFEYYNAPDGIIIFNGNVITEKWIDGGESTIIFLGDVFCKHIKLEAETLFAKNISVEGIFYANTSNDYAVTILNTLKAIIAIEGGCAVSAKKVICKRVISLIQKGFGNPNVSFYTSKNLHKLFKPEVLSKKEYKGESYYEFKNINLKNNIEDYNHLAGMLL